MLFLSGSSHRQPLRAQRSEGVREKIRRECLARVEAQRSALLTRLRLGHGQAGVQAGLQGIIQAVAVGPGGELQGKPHGHECSRSEGCSPGSFQGSFQGQEGPQGRQQHIVGGPEYEELMAELEAALFEDDPAAQAEYLDSLDAAEREGIAQAFLETCMNGPSRPGSGDPGGPSPGGTEQPVICPVCQQAYLVETPAGIGCPRDGYCLERPADGLRLSDLRDRLAHAYEAHAVGGCIARPGFMVSNEFTDVWTLFMTCDSCHAFEVVF